MKVNFKGFYNDQIQGLILPDRCFRLEFQGQFEGVNLPAMVKLFLRDLGAEDSVNLHNRFTKDGIFTELDFAIILSGSEAKCFLDDFQKIIPPNFSVQIIEVEEEVKEEVKEQEN
jgi:hypothetical protein